VRKNVEESTKKAAVQEGKRCERKKVHQSERKEVATPIQRRKRGRENVGRGTTLHSE